MNTQPISKQLRAAIVNCGMTRYRLAKLTGIDAATLSKFLRRQGRHDAGEHRRARQGIGAANRFRHNAGRQAGQQTQSEGDTMNATTETAEKKRSKRRRGNGEGSIFQRADGYWVGTINIGYNEAGKRRRKTVYGETKKAARRNGAAAIAET